MCCQEHVCSGTSERVDVNTEDQTCWRSMTSVLVPTVATISCYFRLAAALRCSKVIHLERKGDKV